MSRTYPPQYPHWLRIGWVVAILVAVAVRLWNGVTGPLLRGYDDHGHVGYILYLDLHHAVPFADQGWSYFHPPLHYLFGWVLAQAGSVEILLHGLALLAGAASLAIAWFAARTVRLAAPARPELELFAFASVSLLPVYLYSSTMAGNEVTAAFFGTLGLALFVGNECRERPGLASDALVGVVLGLALLSKVSAMLVLGACGMALLLRLLRTPGFGAALPRIVLRGIVLAGVAAAVASPYYGRNVSEFGTPLKMSRDNPHVKKLESSQPPGSRTWVDFVKISPELLLDPNPEAPHLLHSVWGTAYAGMWSDTRIAAVPHAPRIRRARSANVILGLAPTLLALLGAGLALRDVLRGNRAGIYAPMFCVAATSLAAFGYFAVAAPQFSALKGSYLLSLTLPYAAFLARGIEELVRPGVARGAALAAALVGVPGLASALVHADGVVLPALEDHKATASILVHFGEIEAARDYYETQGRTLFGPTLPRTDNLGSVALLAGDPFTARSSFEQQMPEPGREPFRWNALAVAAALAGDLEEAHALVLQAVEADAGEVGLVNRAVIEAALAGGSDADASARAEALLRQALALDPALQPAWHALAFVLEQAGLPDAAAVARSEGARVAGLAPRGYPYGVPDGLGQYPSWALAERWMLWPEADALKLARAPYRASNAIAMRDAAEILADAPHIVLVMIDTLRADHLGSYGYPRPTSPNIDRLADEGVRFANVSATSSWTLPSVASLFTSRRPEDHGATAWGRRLKESDRTLVEHLHSAGYATTGVSGNFVHVNEKVGFDRGFDRWQTLSVALVDEEKEALFAGKEGEPGLRAPTAREINEAVFTELPPPGARPLFLYVHYMEPHSEYDPPADLRAAFVRDATPLAGMETVTSDLLGELVRGEVAMGSRELARVVDLYDAEIAAVDRALGELLVGLKARGYGDKLVVAVVSDHGEELDDHGSWFHGLTLHTEALTVPLVVWDSRGRSGPPVIEAPVDLLDVPTTLLGLADIGRPGGMAGRDLLPNGPGLPRDITALLSRDVLLERHLGPRKHQRALTRWPWKVISVRGGGALVYQLEEDPGEMNPVSLQDPRIPAELLAAAHPPASDSKKGERAKRRARRAREQQAPAATQPEPTQKEREQLRALGYAE